MTARLLLLHLLNFIAPAAVLALLLVLLSRLRFLAPKRPLAQSILAQFAIIFAVNLLVLSAGVVLTGQDGKWLSYAALVGAAALCQWVLGRGWRI
jgi:hypothetical protein